MYLMFALIFSSAIFTLRTFAIYQKNYIILALLGALTLAILATDLVRAILFVVTIRVVSAIFKQLYTHQGFAVPNQDQVGPLTCTFSTPTNANQCVFFVFNYLRRCILTRGNRCSSRFTSLCSARLTAFNLGYIASWAITLAFDTTVFILTVGKTIHLAWAAQKLKMRNSVVSLMLRDGKKLTFIAIIY